MRDKAAEWVAARLRKKLTPLPLIDAVLQPLAQLAFLGVIGRFG